MMPLFCNQEASRCDTPVEPWAMQQRDDDDDVPQVKMRKEAQ